MRKVVDERRSTRRQQIIPSNGHTHSCKILGQSYHKASAKLSKHCLTKRNKPSFAGWYFRSFVQLFLVGVYDILWRDPIYSLIITLYPFAGWMLRWRCYTPCSLRIFSFFKTCNLRDHTLRRHVVFCPSIKYFYHLCWRFSQQYWCTSYRSI